MEACTAACLPVPGHRDLLLGALAFFLCSRMANSHSSVCRKNFKISYQIEAVSAPLRALEINGFTFKNLFQLLCAEFLVGTEMCSGFFKKSRSVCKEVPMVRFFTVFSWDNNLKNRRSPYGKQNYTIIPELHSVVYNLVLCCLLKGEKDFINSQIGTRLWTVTMNVG